MKIITRIQAKYENLKRYFTGKPCKHNHISERYTSTGTCIQCHYEYVKTDKYKEQNRINSENQRKKDPEAARKYMREYMKRYRKTEQGRENMDRASKVWYDKNKQKADEE